MSEAKRRGITLVEILISILILGISVGAMLGAFVIGRVSAQKAKHRIEAMNYARAAMEEYRDSGVLPEEDRPIAELEDEEGREDDEASDIATLGGTYTVTTTSLGSELEEVTATVSWPERSLGGGSRTVTEELVTIMRE